MAGRSPEASARELTQADIRRGMEALAEELGEEKAVLFLRAVSEGALDGRFEGPLYQWFRRNPAVAVLGAALLGASVDAIARHAFAPKPKRRLGGPQAPSDWEPPPLLGFTLEALEPDRTFHLGPGDDD